MLVVHFIAQIIERRWRQRQTEYLLGSLPPEVRKDIGWPTTIPWPTEQPRGKECRAD